MNKVELKLNCLRMFDTRTDGFSHGLNFLAQYLMNLGIEKKDVMCFIDKPRDTDQDNPELLDNIKEAAAALVNRLDCGAKLFIQVDSDTDGYTSSAVLINYITRRWPNARIVHRLHNGKEHGVIL
jgi:single-stranded-DNA-specific exonuclease